MKRFVFFEFIYFVLIYVLYMCMFPACCFRHRTYIAQGLVNGVLIETCPQFEGFSVGYEFYIEVLLTLNR